MKRQMLHFVQVLLEEKVVGEMHEDEWLVRVVLVGVGEQLNAVPDRVCVLVVEVDDSQTNERTHAARIQVQCACERIDRFDHFVHFVKAQSHPEPNICRTRRI